MKSIEHQVQELLYKFVLTIIPSEFANQSELTDDIKKLCEDVLTTPHTREHAKRSLALSLDMQIESAKIYDQCLEQVPTHFLDSVYGEEEATTKYNEWYSKWANKYLHLCQLREALDNLP